MVPVQNYRPVVAPPPQPLEPEHDEVRENALRKVVRWETAVCVISVILIVSALLRSTSGDGCPLGDCSW